jgi:hypothetical protein
MILQVLFAIKALYLSCIAVIQHGSLHATRTDFGIREISVVVERYEFWVGFEGANLWRVIMWCVGARGAQQGEAGHVLSVSQDCS